MYTGVKVIKCTYDYFKYFLKYLYQKLNTLPFSAYIVFSILNSTSLKKKKIKNM